MLLNHLAIVPKLGVVTPLNAQNFCQKYQQIHTKALSELYQPIIDTKVRHIQCKIAFIILSIQILRIKSCMQISFRLPTVLQRVAIGTLFDVCWSLVAQTNFENELLLSVFQNEMSSVNHEEVYLLMNKFQGLPLEQCSHQN